MKRSADRFLSSFPAVRTAVGCYKLAAGACAHCLVWSLMLALICAASPARATALFVVGAGGTQAGCGYATIAEAVAAEAAYHGANDYIYITRTQTYTAQAIVITSQNVHIIGGVDDCNHYVPSGTTTVSGSGGSATSVISIRGYSNVTISHLTISGGDDNNDQAGGGIDYAGVGSLAIDNSTITNNHAGYGGGVNFNGSGGPAQLTIKANTLITSNVAAVSGGGIRVEGDATLSVLEPQTFIAYNSAGSGYGGGIEVIGPATADLGSPGYLFAEYVGLLYQNTAKYGGGLSVNAGTDLVQSAYVRLFATDPLHPVRIQENSATNTGGGIYEISQSGGTAGYANVCGVGYRIDGNAAQEGSAIYADENYEFGWGYNGSYVYLSDAGLAGACPGTSPGQLGAVTCSAETCNSIDGNVAENSLGQPTTGSTVLLQSGSYLNADRIRLRGNHGAHAIRLVFGDASDYDFTFASLSNCLLAQNVTTSDLVITEGDTDLAIHNCTFAYNQIGADAVVRANDSLSWTDSIVAQGSLTTLIYTGAAANRNVDYLMSLETAELGPGQTGEGQHVVQADPSFVDAANGDFHLRATSLAIDVAPPVAGDDRDLDNLPHDQDMPGIVNQYGTRDLGAYERQLRYCGAADTLFCDGFQEP